MPSYQNNPFAPAPILLTAGWPSYLFGNLPTDIAPTRFQVTNVALTSNVATITGYVQEGNIPAVGSLISIRGVQAASGAFNVSGVAIASVSINATTGIGTITFALTNANVTSVAAAGLAIVPQSLVFDALANGASIPCVPPINDPLCDSARTFTVQTYFGSLPTAATVTLQGSSTNNDADYQNLTAVGGSTAAATVAGGAVTLSQAQYTLTNERFLRLIVSGVTGGTSPTIAASILG